MIPFRVVKSDIEILDRAFPDLRHVNPVIILVQEIIFGTRSNHTGKQQGSQYVLPLVFYSIYAHLSSFLNVPGLLPVAERPERNSGLKRNIL